MNGKAANPVLSVIVPTYNRAWCIERCLDALLVESPNVPMEVVVVDDGSTDGTDEVLQGYRDAVTIIRQSNGGPGAARNAGVRGSKGALVAFMDSDDENLPGRLKMQVDYMTSHEDVVLTFGAIAFRSRPAEPYLSTLEARDEWSTMADPYLHLLTSAGECVNTMTAMVRRDCFDRVGGFDSRHRCAEDTDLWPRIGELGPFAYHGRPMTLVNDTRIEDKISRSSRVYTDGARAIIGVLKRDRRLSPGDRAIAERLAKKSAEMMLRYDWTHRDRAALREDIEFCRPVFGDAFAMKWSLIGLIPPSVGRALRRAKWALKSRSN